jgi:hypothetical protein
MKPKVIVALLVILTQIHVAHAQSSIGNFYTGSAKVETIEPGDGGQIVPKPDRVVIHDFAVRSDAVTLDQSIAGRLRRHRLLRHGNDEDSTPDVLAQHVQTAFCKALTDQLEKDHIAAARSANTGAEGGGSNLVVDGELTGIDEGSKSLRVMIGLGSGASDLKTHVTVSSVTAGRSTVVLVFDLDSKSGKRPGALPGMATGSLAVGAAKKTVGDKKSTVDADTSRMAKLAAQQIERLIGNQAGPAGLPADTTGTAPIGHSAG